MTTNKNKDTTSPVFAILYANKTYAYICAKNADEALLRAARIKHELELELPMPRAGVEARAVKEGFLSGAPWYGDGYFKWQDELADALAEGNIVCPMCGR